MKMTIQINLNHFYYVHACVCICVYVSIIKDNIHFSLLYINCALSSYTYCTLCLSLSLSVCLPFSLLFILENIVTYCACQFLCCLLHTYMHIYILYMTIAAIFSFSQIPNKPFIST